MFTASFFELRTAVDLATSSLRSLDLPMARKYAIRMPHFLEDFLLSFTDEVKATIKRIDKLIGKDHWPSVGSYKEGVIRRQLADSVPGRCTVGTGFVLSADNAGNRVLSRQIDVLIWDSVNYTPIFRDGSFVVIGPQALRVAMEVKGNLTTTALRDALYNLDSLTQFDNIVKENYPNDPNAHTGFRRYIVGGKSDLEFPSKILNHLHSYHVDAGSNTSEDSDGPRKMTVAERLASMSPSPFNTTSWISGISILDKGVIHVMALDPDRVGYLVTNDAKLDQADHSMGLIRHYVERFLSGTLGIANQLPGATWTGTKRTLLTIPSPAPAGLAAMFDVYSPPSD